MNGRAYSRPAAVSVDRDAEAADRQVRLAASDVSLTYKTKRGQITALKDLNLEVRDGEFLVVVGPSGCGKSTFLKIASGLIAPTEGGVTIDGRPVAGPRSDIGFVFQKANLMPWKTVLNNVLVTTKALGINADHARERAHELLRMVGLQAFDENYPGELSGGMQQRVGLVRGLVHDPKLLLMDEPFAALDAMTRELMALELQKLWLASRKSVVFITHSIPEAVFLADRVLVMSHRPGRIIQEVEVDLPRPRNLDTMATPQFGALCNGLRSHFSNSIALD